MRKTEHYLSMKKILMGVILALVMTLAACGSEREGTGERQMPPPPVTVMKVEKTDVEVLRDYPARVYGSRQVQVRAMVQGILKERRYREGDVVEEEDLLFLIDPEPYEIALRRARAELATASAGYESALRERNRYQRLYDQKAVSTQERDNAYTQYDLALARLELARAAEADGERNLRYTRVRAPITGVTDRSAVSTGNLIEWGRHLTTITRIDPAHILFSLPETDAMVHRQSREQVPEDLRYLEVSVILPDGREAGRKGELDFKASTMDRETGTIAARALFENPEAELIPGQFVRIRVYLNYLEGVFLVPETAISQTREGARLFVINDDGRAHGRSVLLGPVEGTKQVILEGLDEGELVVVDGHVALHDGMPVSLVKTINDPRGSGTGNSDGEVR